MARTRAAALAELERVFVEGGLAEAGARPAVCAVLTAAGYRVECLTPAGQFGAIAIWAPRHGGEFLVCRELAPGEWERD
jgi:hypothetical protein